MKSFVNMSMAEGPGGRYAIVLPGNGSTITSEMEEGGSAASQLHAMGQDSFLHVVPPIVLFVCLMPMRNKNRTWNRMDPSA